jgi:hypothetical protein
MAGDFRLMRGLNPWQLLFKQRHARFPARFAAIFT